MPQKTHAAAVLSILALTSCATTSEYDRQRAAAQLELPAYEQAYKDQNCPNLRFKFENKMSFGKTDALESLKCLEIENRRNDLRAQANGTIEEDELTVSFSHDNHRAIFTYLSSGELALSKAHELYRYTTMKSRFEARSEISRSNQLVAQGLENERRTWEQENRNRAIFLQNLMQRPVERTPIVTTCDRNTVTNTVTCTTR